MNSVSAFAPVNIAWIKYMGKSNDGPMNSSLSVTLNALGTNVTLETIDYYSPGDSGAVDIEFTAKSYHPPSSGFEKLKKFFNQHELWKSLLEKHSFTAVFPKKITITTHNSAPAASGIATSASSFAAFTLAYAALLARDDSERFKQIFATDHPLKKDLSVIASKGSGSAGRSVMGPWVEWSVRSGFIEHEFPVKLCHMVFLVDSSPKEISSSEAHKRVVTSPNFSDRSKRAETRLQELKTILERPDLDYLKAQSLVWSESEDMHQLFHTAVPAFSYQTNLSKEIASAILSKNHPYQNAVITQDAGANLHLFFPEQDLNTWEQFASKSFPNVQYLKDRQGSGASYVGN